MPGALRQSGRRAGATLAPRRHQWVSDEALLRWAPKAYLLVAIGLVPWVVFLAITLPARAEASHYRLAWVGFDCFLALAIARTAYLGWRRWPQAELAAVVTASLLLVDAWFDVTTASTTSDRIQAVALAVLAEVPAAFGSLYLVRRVNRIVVEQLEVAAAVLEEAADPAVPSGPVAAGAAIGEEGRVVLRPDDSGQMALQTPSDRQEAADPAAGTDPVGRGEPGPSGAGGSVG